MRIRTEEVNSWAEDKPFEPAGPGVNLARPTPVPAPPKDYAIEFENVSRRYKLHHEAKLTLQDKVVNFFKKNNSYENFWALKDISFKLERGKTLGIIGANGAGKSTLLKLATRIVEPTNGVIRVNGRVSAMLELGTGFHPELSARDNIYLNGAFYGFDKKQMDERYERIVEFSELGKFIDTPVKHYSSGMYMRLGFAVAITVSPDILIIDEVLAVGDAAFGRKCHRAIEDLKAQSKAMLFVSHAAGEISRFCDEVIYLDKGRLVAQGKPGDILDEYMIASVGPSYFTSKLIQTPAQKGKAETETTEEKETETKEPVTIKPANIISIEEMLLGGKQPVVPADQSRHLQVSNGISQLSQLWQISLPPAPLMVQSNAEPSPEYYISVINPNPEKATFELTGYKKTSGLFDQAVGGLREVPMGNHTVDKHASLLLRLEEGAISDTSLLKVQSPQSLAVEFVEYRLSSSNAGTSNAKASAAPAKDWYFPMIDVRSINNYRLVVFNIQNQPTKVTLSLYRDMGGRVPNLRTFECAPLSQLTIDLNDELAGGEGELRRGERFYGGVALGCSNPVIVERHSLQLVSPSYHLMEALTHYRAGTQFK
jgi:ABC-type polysaccharide/polyol phosphate transport system ATPase subunit